MPKRLTMGSLVTLCKQRADKENDDHISSAEWKSLISEQFGELWMHVSETGLRYFETSTTITANGSTGYTEPTDHLSTVGISRVDSSGRETPLDPLMSQDEPLFRGTTGDARRWTLVDDSLRLYPTPSSGTYKWYYIPQPTDLSAYADADVVDVVSPLGLAYLLWGVCVKAKSKSESDVRLAMAERERLKEEVIVWAANRALTEQPGYRTELRPLDGAYGYTPGDWLP